MLANIKLVQKTERRPHVPLFSAMLGAALLSYINGSSMAFFRFCFVKSRKSA